MLLDNPRIVKINADVEDSLAGELDEDDEPTDVQAEIIEPHPDRAVNDIGLWPDHLSQESTTGLRKVLTSLPIHGATTPVE